MPPRKSIRHDSLGAAPSHGHGSKNGHAETHAAPENIDSLSYALEDSDAWKAHLAADHYHHRGRFWNQGKHKTLLRYVMIAAVAVAQGSVAYFTNLTSARLIDLKFDHVNELLEQGRGFQAFCVFVAMQTFFALCAAWMVYLEPVSAGSGIPEVKCYLNGIDIPRVAQPKTLVTKVLGVICSVSAGLPVGKEGPMVHSGAVVAATLSRDATRNDRERRDFVACGAAAGVCTAFSAPIGGILFALEEGASYWAPSLTWRAFYCSMLAFLTLLCLNTLGSQFGNIGFNKLFSFGNWTFTGDQSTFAVYELFLFMLIGAMGGLIGAVFNSVNERITHWRLANVNHCKKRRVLEVLCVSLFVSVVTFLLPLCWTKCTPLPETEYLDDQQTALVEKLVAFRCDPETEYNELASLFFTEAGVAIRQLFHMKRHMFSELALFCFFIPYIGLAVMVYGIAVPSGLFVPSLLSGAAFGRLLGNLAIKVIPGISFSNTYALVGAAAVLGGMARMTISLTVILLECTGNEQFVLPLMLTLMTARLIGNLFNDDLYHIHIHMKTGVQFLEAELRPVTRHHDMTAGQVMGKYVLFLNPIEKVGVVYDFLKTNNHSVYPIVDKDNDNILYGTIDRQALLMLLKLRAFGSQSTPGAKQTGITNNYVESHGHRYIPIPGYAQVESAKEATIKQIRVSQSDRDSVMDLRPYTNHAPISIQESASVMRTYEVFRTLGLRFLPVVNKKNQIVGTITRADLTPEGLASTMLLKGKKHL